MGLWRVSGRALRLEGSRRVLLVGELDWCLLVASSVLW